MDTVITSPYVEGSKKNGLKFSKDAVLRDYRVVVRSRQASLIGWGEVLSGKAQFGIFGDGKEVAQVAMAYAFKKGDFRAGYYRDQTLMFALGLTSLGQFFAQLYAHADPAFEPAFGGRSMTGHFATRLLDEQGRWKDLLSTYNSSADLSPTASQMPRLIGLAYASKLYREVEELRPASAGFSRNGNEVAFGTIGNASCAEGMFWEAVNAAGVLQVPVHLSIWDDGYGISVPNKLQMTKGDVSKVLAGFQRRPGSRPGIDIHSVAGWDYAELCDTYIRSAQNVRRHHVPAIVHVTGLTQPLGHSTSGSQERYKPAERLAWEKEFDCLRKMREWIISHSFATPVELDEIESVEREAVISARDAAWEAFRRPLEQERGTVLSLMEKIPVGTESTEELRQIRESLKHKRNPMRRDLMAAAVDFLIALGHKDVPVKQSLVEWKTLQERLNEKRYGSDLHSASENSALEVAEVPAVYSRRSPTVSGYKILNSCFDAAFERCPQLIAIGEDVGQLGDVNQGLAQLQAKYGSLRISDTGIREMTILGQAIGMAQRGLRPIAEIQYLDYILYALQIMSDDLATLRWRTCGGQKAPVVIRTRGHRLVGIWHSGSPMAGILNLVRGMYVCVPRDATQAAGFYNTLLRADDTALVVEVLNGYRKKAKLADNIGEFTIPLGVPEILRPGADVTVVTYGACCDIALQAADKLSSVGIEAEVVDVRTLLPFDLRSMTVESLRKTGRILFLDEDYPGGASAYMMQQVIEKQKGFDWLDAAPRTLSAREHRPAYGPDGDYFSKPNREQIFEAVYNIMHEAEPRRFPVL